MVFGAYYGEYGDPDWWHQIGVILPTIEPGSSWTGTIIRVTVFSTTPLGTNVTAEGCSLWIYPIGPAQPEYYRIPITITAGPPPPSIPVGGYSFQIEGYTPVQPLTPYLALITILAIGFITIKRRTNRKTK
jgi:hypothetical protein